MRRGTNLPAVAGFNQIVVLDAIRREPGGLSRVEISEQTGLAPQTISNAARKLIDDGLIREAGTLIQGRGKPRVMLELLPRSRFAVGVHLDPTVITYVLLDLNGSVVAHNRALTPSVGHPADVVEAIASSISDLLADAGVTLDRVLGIGIASPGPIDTDRGVVVDPPLLDGWRNVPLRDDLARATGLPVVLEKDVNAAVSAELWVSNGAVRDFAFFYLGTGIGIGLAVGGDVMRGATGNGGEGGTLVVPPEGLPERRRSEMIGHLATPRFLVDQAVDDGILDVRPDEHDLPGVDAAFSRLVSAADAGDPAAVALFDRAARIIASALVMVINLLDIDEIVFGGPAWSRVSARLTPAINRHIADSPYRTTQHEVRSRDASVGEDVVAVGAACLVLDGIMSPRPAALLITDESVAKSSGVEVVSAG